MKKQIKLLAGMLAITSLSAQAELNLTGPISAATGNFPTYYQDTDGLALDLCLPSPGAERNLGMCLLTGADIPNATGEISFPSNFPGEAFWWNGGSALTLADGSQAILVMALEAAFANEEPIPGDQVVFARIRVRFVAPQTAHYKVTHPYGVEEFDAVAGERVFFTDDIGVLCGTDFTCAAKDGRIGPFLRPSDHSGGLPLDPITVDGKTYIADPGVETEVTGSPFGTNFFKIEGAEIGGAGIDVLETPMFNLMGRVHTGPLASNINVEKATYSRAATGTASQIDVNVTAHKALGQPDPQLKIFGDGISGKSLIKNINNPNHYYGQIAINSDKIPASLYVSDLNEVPGRVLSLNLVDVVTIQQSSYNTATHVLQVKAASSDKRNSGTGTPELFAYGSDGTEFGKLDSTGTLVVTLNPAFPPAEVIVKSNRGGSAEREVTVSKGVNTVSGLVTVDDNGVDETLPINVVANDKTNKNLPITTPVIVRIVTEPEHGSVVVNPDQTVSYSQMDSVDDSDSFSYFLTDAAGNNVSNVAIVSFDVNAGNLGPKANPDVASVGAGATITIDALVNDTDANGDNLIITGVTNVSVDPLGVAEVVDNKISYTAPATQGTQTLSYTVSDGALTTTGTVTVTIDAAEAINIALAEYRTSKGEWRVSGDDSPAQAGVVMTVYAGGGNTLLGTTTTDALGAWDFRSNSALVQGTVKVESSRGGVRTSTVTIRN
jgi:hypothetical protein